MKGKLTNRTDPVIVEVAETLGVPTDLVLATTLRNGRQLALFSREGELEENGDHRIYEIELTRDDDDVLRTKGEARYLPGAWQKIVSEAESA